jgi:hypothetical protein
MTIFGGVLIYLALFGALAGLASLLKPLRFLGIHTRKRGLLGLGLGLLGFTAAVYLPAAETRVEAARTLLDEFAPVFQFNEFHSIAINASKDRVDAAMRAVTPDEIRFYKTLTRMRGLGTSFAQEHRPILAGFTGGWFKLLADHPGQEIVFGHAGDAHGSGERWTVEEFKTSRRSPRIKIAMNFHIQEVDATHCVLSTETRVYAAGPQVLRGFATYWRMIYPGSALIRRMWLRAIKLRAEAA